MNDLNRTIKIKREPSTSEIEQSVIETLVYRQFAASLRQAMDANKLPGFDLFEFHRIFQRTLRRVRPKKEAFKQSVFASEVMNIRKNVLIENYQDYVNVLREEKKRFEADLVKIADDNIDGKFSQKKLDAVKTAFDKAFGTITNELKGIVITLKQHNQ